MKATPNKSAQKKSSILWDYKWQWLAGAVILLALVGRGGFAAVLPFLRFALPVLGIYLVARFAKRKLLGMARKHLKSRLETAMHQMGSTDPFAGPMSHGAGPTGRQKPGRDPGGDTIDLCPKCGSYLGVGHRCDGAGSL